MLQPILKRIRIKSKIKSFISQKHPPRQISATGDVAIELKFYPDNEEDNYTNAVMGINSEFLKVFNGSTTQETTQEIKIEKSVSNRIIELMMMEPNITAKQIAEYLNVSFDGVRYHIKKLRADGKIKREGSTKSGKWVVMKQKKQNYRIQR